MTTLALPFPRTNWRALRDDLRTLSRDPKTAERHRNLFEAAAWKIACGLGDDLSKEPRVECKRESWVRLVTATPNYKLSKAANRVLNAVNAAVLGSHVPESLREVVVSAEELRFAREAG